jgi:hypothetical protein
VGRSRSRPELSSKLLEFKSIIIKDERRRSRQELSSKLLEASRASSAGMEGAGVSRKLQDALRASVAGCEGEGAGMNCPASCQKLQEHPQPGGKEQ